MGNIMQVKIFQAFGAKQINNLQTEINIFLQAIDESGNEEVKHVSTAMGSVSNGGEQYQCLVVTVWIDQIRKTGM